MKIENEQRRSRIVFDKKIQEKHNKHSKWIVFPHILKKNRDLVCISRDRIMYTIIIYDFFVFCFPFVSFYFVFVALFCHLAQFGVCTIECDLLLFLYALCFILYAIIYNNNINVSYLFINTIKIEMWIHVVVVVVIHWINCCIVMMSIGCHLHSLTMSNSNYFYLYWLVIMHRLQVHSVANQGHHCLMWRPKSQVVHLGMGKWAVFYTEKKKKTNEDGRHKENASWLDKLNDAFIFQAIYYFAHFYCLKLFYLHIELTYRIGIKFWNRNAVIFTKFFIISKNNSFNYTFNMLLWPNTQQYSLRSTTSLIQTIKNQNEIV